MKHRIRIFTILCVLIALFLTLAPPCFAGQSGTTPRTEMLVSSNQTAGSNSTVVAGEGAQSADIPLVEPAKGDSSTAGIDSATGEPGAASLPTGGKATENSAKDISTAVSSNDKLVTDQPVNPATANGVVPAPEKVPREYGYDMAAVSGQDVARTGAVSGVAALSVNPEMTSSLVTGPPVFASFTGTPTSGSTPMTVGFTDTSLGSPTSWAWFFGDESYNQAWTEMTKGPDWGVRSAHTSVVMPDGSIVLMGGPHNID